MKRIHFFALLCVPLLIILGLGFGTLKATSAGGQEQQRTGYNVEQERFSTMEFGKLLERLGKEIQQSQSITVGGKTYPFKGMGGLEFNVSSRGPGRVGVHLEYGTTGEDAPSGRGNTFEVYSSNNPRGGTTADVAATMASIAEKLASTGSFVLEEHKVALEGNISIMQRVSENFQQRGGQAFNYIFDVFFGDGGVFVPMDESNDVTEYEEAIKAGWMVEHALKNTIGVDKETVIKLFEALSADLNEGKVKVGSKSFDAGENLQPRIKHTVLKEGNSHRIRVSFQFGEMAPRPKQSGARYSKEFFDEPMKNVAEMLKRIGTEILENGKFTLGENEFTPQEKAYYEINVGQRGFSIELQYVQPPIKDK